MRRHEVQEKGRGGFFSTIISAWVRSRGTPGCPPGGVILLTTWRDHAAAEAFERPVSLHDDARLRRVRVVRDCGMYDRRDAPQYYPGAPNGRTLHS